MNGRELHCFNGLCVSPFTVQTTGNGCLALSEPKATPFETSVGLTLRAWGLPLYTETNLNRGGELCYSCLMLLFESQSNFNIPK